jgi:hypothetical protein
MRKPRSDKYTTDRMRYIIFYENTKGQIKSYQTNSKNSLDNKVVELRSKNYSITKIVDRKGK